MDYWVPSLSSASQIAGEDPETKGKGEVSISKRKWGKPPHLFVLLELESMVPVVFSRCRETVSSSVPAPSFHYGGRREARAPRRPRTASRTSGLGRAESDLFRPAPRPRPFGDADWGDSFRVPGGGGGLRGGGGAEGRRGVP